MCRMLMYRTNGYGQAIVCQAAHDARAAPVIRQRPQRINEQQLK